MRNFLLLIIAGIFACIEGSAQHKGVDFRIIDFEKALENAGTENRLVFMDCYTSWCGPCKAMARDVFTVDSIADYFNSTFVCIKYDMEKEGKELAKRYPLSCYPTFLIIDENGKELHRLSGYYSPEKLMQAIRMLKPENTLEQLEIRFRAGERTPEFMEPYLIVLKGSGELERMDDVLSTLSLYQSEKDIADPVRWRILSEFQSGTKTPDVRFFLAHLPQFRDRMGKEVVDQLLDKLYAIEVTSYIYWEQKTPGKGFDMEEFNRFISELQQLEFDKQAITLALALTEKMYRENRCTEAIHYIQTARQFCIMPRAYQLQYFSVFIDKLIALAHQPEDLRTLREECDRMLGYTSDNLSILMKKYSICYKLQDRENLAQLKTDLDKAAKEAGYVIVYGDNGQIDMKK